MIFGQVQAFRFGNAAGRTLFNASNRGLVVRQLMTSARQKAIAKPEKTPIQKWGYEYLQKQKGLKRPISPHLQIYKPQLTWMLSGFFRFTGCAMSIAACVGGAFLLTVPYEFTAIIEGIRSWNIPAPVTAVIRYAISYCIAFHLLNGFRFFGYSYGKGLGSLGAIYQSGYAVLAASAVLALVFTFWRTPYQPPASGNAGKIIPAK